MTMRDVMPDWAGENTEFTNVHVYDSVDGLQDVTGAVKDEVGRTIERWLFAFRMYQILVCCEVAV